MRLSCPSPETIKTIASRFLGKPYLFEPLGEGQNGTYSTLPLYSFDHFDCVTFVDTVLALYYSTDTLSFEKNMIQMRYQEGLIDYTNRTDWFTDLEWNPRLQQLGYLTDITSLIAPVDYAHTVINKSEWYAKKVLANVVRPDLAEKDQHHLLSLLRSEGQRYTPQKSQLSFIPFETLLSSSKAWDAFPPLSIVEIVRPDWRPVNPHDKTTDYGTSLNVAHMGIAIKENKKIVFYHASSTEKKVVCLPLIDYLQFWVNDTRPAPIRGIHIEKIRTAD